MTILGVRFSPEVRLDTVLAVIGFIGGGFMAWGNLTAEIGLIKHSQSSQQDTNRRIETNIQEVKQEVRETGSVVRSLERRMDRARM